MHWNGSRHSQAIVARRSERRAHHRRPTSLMAQILLGTGSPGLSCTVRDISAGGAGLAFAEPTELPAGFVLAIPNLDLMVAAHLRWSHGERHGVAFVWPQHQ
ncbi:PilZ domain-containing protein [Microvirga arabica]|uniref:PilZ domain-containing protein n=1 Tax=Microvirga arabica TaxID=1128671 RepID=A0ABV6Y9F4_9HYPH